MQVERGLAACGGGAADPTAAAASQEAIECCPARCTHACSAAPSFVADVQQPISSYCNCPGALSTVVWFVFAACAAATLLGGLCSARSASPLAPPTT